MESKKILHTKQMTFEQLIEAMRIQERPKGDIALSWCKRILYFYDKGELVYKGGENNSRAKKP